MKTIYNCLNDEENLRMLVLKYGDVRQAVYRINQDAAFDK